MKISFDVLDGSSNHARRLSDHLDDSMQKPFG